MEVISYGWDEMEWSKMKGGKYKVNFLSLHYSIIPFLDYAKRVIQVM